MIIGHNQLVRDFKNLIKNNRLAHGYVFFGEPEVGKFYFAKHLADFLENGGWEISKRPLQDALILENASGIEEMRQLKSFLWQKPVISSKRLVIINDAENLTPQAQNAILKITEEPPENSVLILAVSQPENLLPALLSRLQKIYFGRLPDSEMEKIISDKQILALASGRPGRAVRFRSEPLIKKGEEYARQFLRLSGQNRSTLIKALVEEQKDLPELLDRFFEALIIQLRQDSRKNFQILKSALHRLFLIKSYNTNKRLQLEAIN